MLPLARAAFLLVLFICTASAATASRQDASTPLTAHQFQTGIYLDYQQKDPLAFARARAAGTTIVRLEVPWADIAPAVRKGAFDASNPDDPAYNWSTVDAQVKLATAQHLQPLLTLYKAPGWAQTGPGDKSNGALRVDPLEFADFASAAATRYDGRHGLPRVRYWQAWNEPNVNAYLAPEFAHGRPAAPALYRQMLNAFATVVHAANPTNLVVAAGLSPFTVKSGATVTIGPLKFMRYLLCMSAGANPKPTCSSKSVFDIWAHNPYTSGDATHHATNPDDVSLGDLPKMRALLAAAYRAHHIVSHGMPRFWVTEFSWDTNPPDPGGVPLALHARWTAEALYQMWKSGVDTAIWLALRDEPYPASPFQAGLYFRGPNGLASDKPKPALTAFTFPFVAYMQTAGVSVWARTPFGKQATVVVERRMGATWERLGIFRTDRFGILSRTLSGSFAKSDILRVQTATDHSLGFSLTRPPDQIVDPFGS
jgi:hypothetical protein